MHQALLDHAAEDDRVDVPAADNERYPLSADAPDAAGHHCRERRGRGPLDNRLLKLEHTKYRERDRLLLYAHDPVEPPADEAEGDPAHGERRKSVGQGCAPRDADRPAGLQRRREIARGDALDRDDLDPGPQGLYRDADPGKQAAAANRADDRIDVRHLLQDLEAKRALAADDVRRVESVDVAGPLRGDDPVRL